MKKLGLLKFDDLYKTQCMLLIHDSIYANAPLSLKSCLSSVGGGEHNLRSQAAKPLDLKIPPLKSRAGTNSFSAKAPSFWNHLPTEVTVDSI